MNVLQRVIFSLKQGKKVITTAMFYLLTSAHSFSAAASFSWAFKKFGMGKVIGEETGGVCISFGDVLMYQMPYSRLTASISYKQFWQYGADEKDFHGTIPDYIVSKEEALSKALELCVH
ncbi:MAG: hypothetical protein IJS20_00275 [Bacteroidales bacterium]|nr:hypothetical protein [Bacteroidales bacterium]